VPKRLLIILLLLLMPSPLAAQVGNFSRVLINGTVVSVGSGSPESSVVGSPGDVYIRTNGTIYTKTSGTGNTGWTLMSSGGGSGTVTSVALTMPGIFSVSGSPVTTSGTSLSASNISSGTLAAARGGAGASNGILKANGSGVVSAATSGTDYAPATSGSLPLFGNGSGAFTNGTVQGNTTKVVTYAGSGPATNDCAKFDANGNVTTAGAACASGAGTPGGSSGDWQKNSSGSFAGVTPGTGVETFVTTPSSANLRAALTDEVSYANYPPTVADTITASAKPTLSSATKAEDSTLTGWSTSVTAGDVIGFKVDSATTVTRVLVEIEASVP
jgi:hypothetical protein